MRKSLRIGVVLLAAAALGAGWHLYGRGETSTAAQVITAPVARATIEQTVLANGTLKPARLVAVGAQVSGRITSVGVALGQEVKAGDLIAEIDSVTQLNQLRTAEAALAGVRAQRTEREANLALAERTLTRQQEMVTRNAGTRVDFDSAGEQVEVLKAQIAALDAQIIQGEVAIETARANVGYTKITAPIDGTVLAIVSQEGQTVNASQSAPTIVILGQLDRMTVRAEISEADIVRIRPGQEVWFNIIGEPGKRYSASLETVEPAPESIRNDSSISTASSSSTTSTSAIYYNGVFTVPNPEQALRTYMTAQVHIVLGRAEDVLTVPFSAVTLAPAGQRDGAGRGEAGREAARRGGGRDGASGRGGAGRAEAAGRGDATRDGDAARDGGAAGDRPAATGRPASVRVLGSDGQVERREITVGLDDKVLTEVVSGLSEGEAVVTGDGAAGAGAAGRPMARRGPPMGL